MILKILTWPDKRLSTECKDVVKFDKELKKDISNMFDTLKDSGGIGLAANQVGIDKKVFVINIPYTLGEDQGKDNKKQEDTSKSKDSSEDKQWWHNKNFVFINPKIVSKTGKVIYQEGCLSFPHIFENITRASKVVLEYFDEEGKSCNLETDGLFAICIQHEFDHLYGISFVDRMSRLKSMVVKKKLIRLSQNNWEEL